MLIILKCFNGLITLLVLQKVMREVVLKKSNRGFLDLFWEITSPEVAKSDAAVKDLLSHLSAQRNVSLQLSYLSGY